jgi:DNA-directed RNA polymerase alpha subunit
MSENKEINKLIRAHEKTILLLSREIASLKEKLDFVDVSVEELELSVRSANCLRNKGIETIDQLLTFSEAELLKLKNFGRKNLNEIRDILNEKGLNLRRSNNE